LESIIEEETRNVSKIKVGRPAGKVKSESGRESTETNPPLRLYQTRDRK